MMEVIAQPLHATLLAEEAESLRHALLALAKSLASWCPSVRKPEKRPMSVTPWMKPPLPTRDQARSDVFNDIEMFYNPKWRHNTAGSISPVEFERRHFQRLTSV